MATNTTNYRLTKPDESDFYNITDFNGNADIIDELIHDLSEGKSDKSHSASVTLLAASWSSGQYTLTNAGITATNVVELYPAVGITAEQLAAMQGANIIGGTQAAGSITLVAMGDVPTINIPVTLVLRGDL